MKLPPQTRIHLIISRLTFVLALGFAAQTAPGATFTVINTNLSGAGSLQQAIFNANTNAGTDTVAFNIASGGLTISPTGALPVITEAVLIDGYTQPGASTNSQGSGHNAVLKIRLDGAAAGANTDGLKLGVGGCTVRGLAITRFGGDGIEITNGAGSRVEGCYLGLAVDGLSVQGNGGNGVLVLTNATGTVVGGNTAGTRNVISGNNRGVYIDGSSSNSVLGCRIGTDATGSLARGNTNSGVFIRRASAKFNTIGGTTSAARNVISGNGELFTEDPHGITLSQCLSNSILGNYVGTTAAGTAALGNLEDGVSLQSGANTNFIGGTAAGAGNLISGNNFGINFATDFPSQNGNIVRGNFLGTDASGMTAIPNVQSGVNFNFGSGNVIGGTVAGSRNIISGNGSSGIQINPTASTGNLILGNSVGTSVAGGPLGNGSSGINAWSDGNIVGGTNAGEGNVIAFNDRSGVSVLSFVSSCPIRGNNIFSNDNLGIDLDENGRTLNDTGDGDGGGNTLQNFPELASALIHPASTIVVGTLNSAANATFRVEFFDSQSCDPSGYGEGQVYLGFTNITTDAGGNKAFTFVHPAALASGRFVTATATDTANNTSEFSACARAVPFDSVDLSLTKTISADPAPLATSTIYTLTVSNAGPATATGVVATDALPAGLTYVNATPSQGSLSFNSGVVTCNLGTLASGSAATVAIEVKATSAGPAHNTAAVAAAQLDNAPANNSAELTSSFGIANLAVRIADSPDPVIAGGQLMTYTITVTNAGPDAALNVFMNFAAPFDFCITSASVSQGTQTEDFNYFTCEFGTLAKSGVATLTVTGRQTESGTANVNAFVSSDVSDSDNGDDFVFGETTVNPGAGVFRFAEAEFFAREKDGLVLIEVSRVGGAAGAVTVHYATSNLTAVAGADFTSTNGTLTFNNGVTSLTFGVPVINDTVGECNETLKLTLFTPGGGGVIACDQSSATLFVADDDTPFTGTVAAINVASNGALSGFAGQVTISADGRLVAFSSDDDSIAGGTAFAQDVFVRDLVAGTNRLISAGADGFHPQMSRDGRYVVMLSQSQLWRHNLATGNNELVSINTSGLQSSWSFGYYLNAPEISVSSNGQFVAFMTGGADLTTIPDLNQANDIYVRDLGSGATKLASRNFLGTAAANGGSYGPIVSANGQSVAYTSEASDIRPGDTNGLADVFVFNIAAATNAPVNVSITGAGLGNGSSVFGGMSANGRYVLFESEGSDLVANDANSLSDVFVRDIITGTTLLVSVKATGTATANGHSHLGFGSIANLSADGRYVLFASSATDLVAGDPNPDGGWFLRDLTAGVTRRVDLNCDGSASGFWDNLALSESGRFIVFSSQSMHVVPGYFPNLGYNQVFRHDLATGESELASHNFLLTAAGDSGSGPTGVMSQDGSRVLFTSGATDLVSDNTNSLSGTYVWTAVVTPPPAAAPKLSATLTNNQLLISWPSSTDVAFALQSTTNLNPIIVWTAVTNTVANDGLNRSVLINRNPTEPKHFYRLKN